MGKLKIVCTNYSELLGYAPNVKIAGHNQFDNKGCPSFFVPAWLKQLGIPKHNIEWRDPFEYKRYFKQARKR
ncbi:hypothetical protein [Xanthocytophaga agilis]|uniref:hypothetical protein n=1 Tax=Xanthocytophaga agilis TaxID=3048010 RepID=UPI0028D7A081|nr:hypothetical protein [Xanthocytophaga agilis]